MNKEKIKCLVDIGMNLPRAGLEVVLLGSMPVGVAAGTIGAGVTYLWGYPDISKGLLLGGFSGAVLGFFMTGIYAAIAAKYGEFGIIEDYDYAIDKVCDGIEKYKQLRKNEED